MRKLIKHGLVAVSLSLLGCGSSDKPPQEPYAMNTPPPPPMPESKPSTTDPKPIDSSNMGGATSTTTITSDQQTQTQTPTKPAEKQLTDAEIVAVTSTANTGEIEMGELAKKSATTPEVKNYAVMMITQHKDMENKRKAIVTKAKITPTESDASTMLKNDINTSIGNLKTQKGKDFDKAYIDAQVKAHREVIDVIDNKLLPNVQSPDVKKELTDARKTVAMHLAKAEEIQTKLEATPPAKAKTPKTDTQQAPKK